MIRSCPFSFLQACLIKDPKQRPSAEQLLRHEWITRHDAGEVLLSQAQLQAGTAGVARTLLLAAWDSYGPVMAAAAKSLRSLVSWVSSAINRKAAIQAANLPGNATSQPHDIYVKGSLPVAMGRKAPVDDQD